jgi:hypothetical protein
MQAGKKSLVSLGSDIFILTHFYFSLSSCFSESVQSAQKLDAEIKLYLTPGMFTTDNLSMINSSISRLSLLTKIGTVSSVQ